MGVTYHIIYHKDVASRDIPQIGNSWKKEICHAIEVKLSASPEVFGVPLRNTLKGYRKLRVGDYRIIFRIESKTVKIFAIGHRSSVYLLAGKRV